MKDICDKLRYILGSFDEKQQKKLRIQVLINLCEKLNEQEYKEVLSLIRESYELLDALKNDENLKPRPYLKSFLKLQKEVRNRFGYTEKGLLKKERIGVGLAIGVALGTPFISISPALIGIGLPLGLAIGVASGERKEKEAEEKGLVY